MRWLIHLMITSMIFFPEKAFYEKPEDYRLSYENVSLQTEDKVELHGWHLQAQNEKGTILFFHGNAGNISGRLFKAKGWVERGYSVLLVDYRGYGKSQGKIDHQDDVLKDARAAWAYLLSSPRKRIILYGESLGTFPATVLAAEPQASALILEAPFTSFVDLGGVHYPFVPKSFLKDFAFSNMERIGAVRCPVFILHGTRDEICPFSMAEKLFAAAPSPKEFFSIPGGMHNDLPYAAGADFWERPLRFLASHQS